MPKKVKIIANPDHIHYRNEGTGRRTLCGRYSPIGLRARLFARHETHPPIATRACPTCQQQAALHVEYAKAKVLQQQKRDRFQDDGGGGDDFFPVV